MRTSEKWQPHSDEKSTKMKGLLSFQIFYAPFSKWVQSIWKQYRPLETILYFSRWSRKRTPTASQKQKQIELKILYFFRTNFQFKSFPAFFTFNRVCMIKPLLWIREKCVSSRNTDNYKVWNKYWVIGNLLRWTPFVIFQKYSSPFLIIYQSKSIYSLLYGVLRRYEARKITKIEEFWWNKLRTSEKWQPHSDEKSTKMKGLLSFQIFYAPLSKWVQSIWKQYRPLETILYFSRWSRKRTPTASQKQKQIELKILYFFRTNFQFKSFPAFFTFNRVCMIKPLLWIREKCVPSRKTDN